MKKVGWKFSPSEIGNVFACGTGTMNAMDKWRLPFDSAHQIGSEAPWVDALTVDGQCSMKDRRCPTEFWKAEKLVLFLQRTPQPAVLWMSGGTAGFSRLKRCRNALPWNSDHSLKLVNNRWMMLGWIRPLHWVNIPKYPLLFFFSLASASQQQFVDFNHSRFHIHSWSPHSPHFVASRFRVNQSVGSTIVKEN